MSLRAAAFLLAWLAALPAFGLGGQDPAPEKVPAATAKSQGPPAQAAKEPVRIVRAILVEGEQRYSEAQLISALGQKVGEPLDVLRIDRGLRSLWESFHVRGSVFYESLPALEGKPLQVDLLLRVVEMPSDREPRFTGNVEIPDKTLKRWALLEDRVELFEYQVQRVRQRLLEGYRREGFYWVEIKVVTAVLDPPPGELAAPMTDVIFEIQEGPKVRVKGVHVHGNKSMPDRGFLFWKDGLTSFAKRELKPPGLFSWRGSAFVEETLDADILAMRTVYRERGWLDAVVELQRLEWSVDRSKVQIHIVVDEGEPYVVQDLKIEFLEWTTDADGQLKLQPMDPARTPRHSAEELLAKCDLKPGARYEEILVNRDTATLRDLYGSEGYLSHESLPIQMRWSFRNPEVFYRPGEHELQVTYRIVEGRPLTLREITFAGTHHTRDEVLRREVSVFPGGKADLREIIKGLNRIQATGYFSNQFAPEDHREPTFRFIEVEGSKDLVDLEYQVQEGRVVEFNISGGIDSNEGAYGLITLEMKNFDWADPPTKFSRTITELLRKEAFHGDGQLITIELSPGTEVSRARFRFLEPDIFDLYLRPISLDLDLRRQLRIYQSHDEDRFDKSIKFGRRLNFDTSLSVGVIHSDIEVSDLDDSGVPIALERQEALDSTVQSGFTLDGVSRSLDNYLNPHNGWKVSLRNSLFTKVLSSDFEYLRSDLQFDGYLATGTKKDGTEHVLHLEFDAGVMPTYGDTDEVPYTERFFQGGSNNLKGFALRGAGDRGTDALGAPTDFAAGGETYLSGSVEWLYPLYSVTQPGTYRQIESLRGVLFLDWGVLGPEPFEIDLEETRASIGFGVGLAYPLPIQLNFGFPIRSFSGDEEQIFSFSIGLSF